MAQASLNSPTFATQELPIQTVVLAGGLGTRLRPLTDQMPKAMIPIHGKPFIHFQLDWLARHGVQEVILSTGYLANMIEEFVGTGSRWGLRVKCVNEGPQLRGTGGAIRLIHDQGLLQDAFLVTYGDSFLPIHFRKIWEIFLSRPEPALMTVLKNHEKWDTSNACFNEKLVTLYDKKAKPKPPGMDYIDYGLSVLRKELIKTHIPPNEVVDLATLFHKLSLESLLGGYEVQERFYEVGSWQGIQDFESFVAHWPLLTDADS